jgi:cell division protein FtsB
LSSKKGKFWKVLLIVLCFLGAIAAWLAFGERGLLRLYNAEMERQAHIDRIRRLAAENRALLEEINRLRTDIEYAESVARRELNLIKENEVIYRFKKKPADRIVGTIPPKPNHAEENRKTQKEETQDGGIK